MTENAGSWSAEVPDTWLQGRSLFGGIQAALAVRAMRSLVAPGLPLRVLQVTFAAPVAAGIVGVHAGLLRAGRSASHVEARLVQGTQTLAVLVGVFGSSRPSRVRVIPKQPDVTIVNDPIVVPYVEGLTPRFLQHFDMRWLLGDGPFSGSTRTTAVLEVGVEDDGPTTVEHILAIADAPPPLALSHLDSPAAGSSMTWTLEMLTDRVSDLPLRGYRLDIDLVAGSDGYTSQSVMVWGPRGGPVALSRQSMVVFG